MTNKPTKTTKEQLREALDFEGSLLNLLYLSAVPLGLEVTPDITPSEAQINEAWDKVWAEWEREFTEEDIKDFLDKSAAFNRLTGVTEKIMVGTILDAVGRDPTQNLSSLKGLLTA